MTRDSFAQHPDPPLKHPSTVCASARTRERLKKDCAAQATPPPPRPTPLTPSHVRVRGTSGIDRAPPPPTMATGLQPGNDTALAREMLHLKALAKNRDLAVVPVATSDGARCQFACVKPRARRGGKGGRSAAVHAERFDLQSDKASSGTETEPDNDPTHVN